MGHTASSAHHNYEAEVLKEQEQHSMDNSSINPGIQLVHRLYRYWRKDRFGAKNGKCLFDQLEHNEHNNESGGKAVFQKYSGNTTQDSSK